MKDQSQMMKQPQIISPAQMMSLPQVVMSQPPQVQGIGQPQMMNRSYGIWPPPPPQSSMEVMKFPNTMNQGFAGTKPMKPRSWMGKKGNDNRKDGRRKEMTAMRVRSNISAGAGGGLGLVGGGGGGYNPPTLNELQNQNRLKARRFYPKKKFNRFAPFAPRNTTSFIIRAKRSGGIAELVSPCPVTPAVLPTPSFSPSREVLGDMAKEEWGVDGYGSMKGLIRLRSPGHEAEVMHEDDEEEEGGSSESDVEEHIEVERRLDHDLSRFEMIYPNYGFDYNNVLENRVDDQDAHIGQLEEENLMLKERLFLMEREMGVLRRRLQNLERQNQAVEEINEEVVENLSENESDVGEDVRSTEENDDYVVGENEKGGEMHATEDNNENVSENQLANYAHMEESPEGPHEVFDNQLKQRGLGSACTEKDGHGICMEERVQMRPFAENRHKDGGEGN